MKGTLLVLVCAAAVACGRDHFDPVHNIAFVTSAAYDPSTFGADLSGADGYCAASAAAAGLAGTYVAWLNTSQISAPDRLAGARGWIRVDGAPLADSVDDLMTGRAYRPLRVDEFGEEVAADHPVAIGLLTATADIHSCTNWTTQGGVYDTLSSDQPFFAAMGNFFSECVMPARLFCFGTTFDVPLPPASITGRRAFVTVQGFTAGGGLAAADALCNQEASLAGIPGTFLAALSTSTQSASSRFDLSGPNWVRLDGVPLAASPLALIAGDLDTTFSISSAGTPAYECAATGGALGMSSTFACLDWTSATSSTFGGTTTDATSAAFTGSSPGCVGCDGRSAIYCLER